MREIKFRAWDKTSNLMRTDITSIEFKSDGSLAQINVISGADILYPEKEAVLMQYTGLKDRNGVEIYEGDIIKSSNPHIDNREWAYWSIEWSADGYDYIGRFLKSGYGPNFTYGVDGLSAIEDDYRDIEVIGNIYENPELLGGKDDEN